MRGPLLRAAMAVRLAELAEAQRAVEAADNPDQVAAARSVDQAQAELEKIGRALRRGLGTGICVCGKVISTNKAACFACAKKAGAIA
jgi:hypothetical protein